MIDELLGRLEASTVKFDIGRGGIPELTPQDVAAALGMCTDRFACEIYLLVVGSSCADSDYAYRQLAAAQFAEWKERADRLLLAQLKLAEAQVEWVRAISQKVRNARAEVETARSAMWPHLLEETYRQIRVAVVTELREPTICRTCNGHGQIMVASLKVNCSACAGTGRIGTSDRLRAMRCGMHITSYRERWRPVYNWTFDLVSSLAQEGRVGFEKALSRAA